jgi:hypothetical protein
MRPIFVSILCTAALTARCANADEFSWELTGGARRSELGPATDADVATISATYYFRPVDDGERAYALAPFLGRASHIGARYHEDKTTSLASGFAIAGPFALPPTGPTTVVTRAAGHGVSGRHVWRMGGWYAGGAFAEADAAHPAPLSTSLSVLGDELTTRSVTFGKYVTRSTTVELSLEAATASLASELFLPCTGLLCTLVPPSRIATVIDTEVDNAGVAAVHVGRLGRFDYALAAGITHSQVETSIETTRTPLVVQPPRLPPVLVSTQPVGGAVGLFSPAVSSLHSDRYSLAAELFPTRALGIRVSYAGFDGEDTTDAGYDLAATWFFRRNIGARLVLSRTKSALQLGDVDAVGLQLMGRL